MPIAKVQMPDGRIGRFEVPEGTTQEQVLRYAEFQTTPQQSQKNEPSFLLNVAGGLETSFTDPMKGLAQLGLSGASKAAQGLGFNETAKDLSGGLEYLNTRINNPTPEEIALRESTGGTIGNIAGNVLQLAGPSGYASTAMKATSKLPVAAKALPYVSDAAAAFGLGYIQPEKEGGDRLGSAAVDSALSILGRGGSQSLGKFVDASKAPLLAVADKLKIPVGIAGMTENPLVRFLATQSNNLSLTNPRGRAAKAFNRAVSNTFGENTDELTPSVLAGAQERIGGVMDEQYKKGISDTTQLQTKLAELLREQKKQLTPSQYGQLESTVSDITSLIDNNSLIPQAAENLSKTIRGRVSEAYKGSDSVLANALKEPKNALETSLMGELSPEAAQSLQEARKQYAALKMAEHLATIGGGNVTPARLLSKVASETGDKLSSAGEIGKVAEVGAKYLKNTVPDSGTATRSLLVDLFKQHPLTASAGGIAAGSFAPVATAALLGGSTVASELLHSPTFRKALAIAARGGKNANLQYLLPSVGITEQGGE